MSNKITIPAAFSRQAGIGLPNSRVSLSSRNSLKYVSYSGDGQRGANLNLYPQEILRMAYDSPTNYAALSKKAFLTKGRGIDLAVLPDNLVKTLKKLNKYNDNINDILERVAWDYVTLGVISLKVVWGNDGFIKEIYHVPAANVRVSVEDGEVCGYVISNNWDRMLTNSLEKTYSIRPFNPNIFEEIPETDGLPEPTEEQVDNAEQLIYLFDYKPNYTGIFEYYPIPDYIGAFDAILTEIEIGISNKSIIDNGLGAKYIVTFPENLDTDEQKAILDQSLKASFAGAKHNGGVITLFSDQGSDSLPQIDLMNAADANTYLEVDKNVKQSIISAHTIPPILVEYNYGGGFNNRAEEMDVALRQFQDTKIKSYQDFILRTLSTIVSYLGWEEGLTIIPFLEEKTIGEESNTSIDEQVSGSETSLIQ